MRWPRHHALWLGGLSLALGGCRTPATISPYAPEIRFVGHVDRQDPAGPRFAWSGTQLELRFTGSVIRIHLRDLEKRADPEGRMAPNRFQVMLDSEPPVQVYADENGDVRWEAKNLRADMHTLLVHKQTEAFVGEAQLVAVELEDGSKLLPAQPHGPRSIELIGDSITTGYGNEGQNKDCPFSAQTQNHWLTYGAIAARELSAEAVTVAWSGKGVVQNYHPGGALLPELYDRVLPDRSDGKGSPGTWEPQVVVINLGSNDFAHGDPGEARFVDGYRAFVARVRAKYPEAHIFCANGSIVADGWPPGVQSLTLLRRYLQAAIEPLGDSRIHYLEFSPPRSSEGLGCDYHPSLAAHRRMGAELVAAIRERLGW